jgi:hypothetical protein
MNPIPDKCVVCKNEMPYVQRICPCPCHKVEAKSEVPPKPTQQEIEMLELPWQNNPEDDYERIQGKLNEVIRYVKELEKKL